MRKKNKEKETTTNRSVYNKIHKEINAGCPYCQWHKGCNGEDRFFDGERKKPNWKLVSKRKKQWMGKPLKKVYLWYSIYSDTKYVEIKW